MESPITVSDISEFLNSFPSTERMSVPPIIMLSLMILCISGVTFDSCPHFASAIIQLISAFGNNSFMKLSLTKITPGAPTNVQ